jgi:hypothetical protein
MTTPFWLTMPVYKDKDLKEKAGIISQARALWRLRCEEYVAKHGDVGSCVIGAGIEVDYLPPRCRHVRCKCIISADDVAAAQGSITWETSTDEVLKFLRDNGIEAYYNPGRMN